MQSDDIGTLHLFCMHFSFEKVYYNTAIYAVFNLVQLLSVLKSWAENWSKSTSGNRYNGSLRLLLKTWKVVVAVYYYTMFDRQVA